MEKNPNLENLNFDFSFFPAHNMNLHPPTPPVQRESNNITVQQSIHIKNIEIVYSGYDLAHIPIYILPRFRKKNLITHDKTISLQPRCHFNLRQQRMKKNACTKNIVKASSFFSHSFYFLAYATFCFQATVAFGVILVSHMMMHKVKV